MTHFLQKSLFTFLLLLQLTNYAQSIEISGDITDLETKTPIDFATVQIEEPTNHKLLAYGFSDEKGNFKIEGKTQNDSISLVISYIGYTTYKKTISLKKHNINIGNIVLHPSAENLDAIVITATPPVLIKNDTTQFNASAFKTREDAVAEDLLKKLPGVSIDLDTGGIQVNGIDVTRILVNGEPFFSNNPKIAMKVIDKDIIAKIEVTNTRTDEEEFTKTNDSDVEAKTINIILKKRKNGNIFGNAMAGMGTNNRYETNGVFNRLKDKSLFTAIAFANNVNKNNLSYDEDDGVNSIDNSRSINTESNIGTNYSDKLKNGDRINVDYLYSNNNKQRNYRTDSENLLPNSTNYSLQNTSQEDKTFSHDAGIKLNNNITSNLRVFTSAKLYYRDRDFVRKNDKNTEDNSGNLINTSDSNNKINQIYRRLNSSLSAVYRFPKLNSYINYRINTTVKNSDNISNNKSKTDIFGSNARTVIRNQYSNQISDEKDYKHTLKYNQRIGDKSYIEYEFSNTIEDQDGMKEVFDIDDINNSKTINSSISYDQEIDINKKEHKIGYGYRTKNIRYSLKASKLLTNLTNNELNRNIGVSKDFNDLLIYSNLRYRFPNNLYIDLNYKTNSDIPRASQLLTITDNTNPLSIRIGNPNLKRELEHSASINMRMFMKKSKVFIYSRFTYSTVSDKIIDIETVDPIDLVTTRTYTNNSSNNRYSLRGSISKDYKKAPYFYSIKMKWNANVGDNSHLVNNILYKSHYASLSPTFYTELNYNDLFEISPFYKLSVDKTQYTNNTAIDIDDQSNTQHTMGVDVATFAPKKFTLYNQIQYNYNPQFEKGYGRESVVWNITANYNLIPNKAKLKLTVYNLLNQYNNTTRSFSESRNTTSTYDVLQQYAMLSFKYNFKN
ncbi:carboxypeptidase-like regulatory domain-containing protein [Wenyingzhuangia sp. IMCC45467]